MGILSDRQQLAARLLALALSVALIMTAWPALAAAADEQLVTVVRDTTAASDCTFSINHGPSRPCEAGSVLSDVPVTRAEAERNGEAYVVRAGDPQAYRAAVDRIVASKTAESAASHARARGGAATQASCDTGYNYASSWTPTFYTGDRTTQINHSVDFYITPDCAGVRLDAGYIRYDTVSGQTAAYLEKHEYAGSVWNRGCVDIPVPPSGADYTNLGGTYKNAGSNFVTTVVDACGPFAPSSYNLIYLF